MMRFGHDHGMIDIQDCEEQMEDNGQVDSKLGYIHYTKAGDNIPLYKLEDSHLLNIIALFSHRLSANIQSNSSFGQPDTMMDAIMEGPDRVKQNAHSIKLSVGRAYVLLGRYMFEAMRRGLIIEATEKAKTLFNVINNLLNTRIDGTPIAITHESEEKDGQNED